MAARGLETKGLKPALVQRLEEALASEKSANDADNLASESAMETDAGEENKTLVSDADAGNEDQLNGTENDLNATDKADSTAVSQEVSHDCDEVTLQGNFWFL